MIPVVISENGIGLPVREVEGNAPLMIVAENGLGMPIVLSDLGQPFVVLGASLFRVTLGAGDITSGSALTAIITPDPAPLVPTFQFTDDGTNIPGATTNPATFTIGSDGVADASLIRVVATIDGVPYTSNARRIVFAAGTAPSISAQTFTVDTAISAINAAASGANLTFTYAALGLPAGLSINASTGSITGTPTAASSGTASITATDQYGRILSYGFSFTASLRAQATGGADLDLSFVEDSAISATNLIANWTLNGNTLTFVSVSPALPAGLSINAAGTMSGTPTTPTADATYTLTMADEYGRQTSDTFTLQITEVVTPVDPDITVATFTSGTPDTLAINVDYTGADDLRVILATRNGGSPLTPAQMQAGTGTFIELFIIDPFVDATVDLDAAFTSASNAADAIDILAIEANNGGVSSVSTVAVSGLNFGAGWAFSGSSITSSPTVAAPTVSGSSITG